MGTVVQTFEPLAGYNTGSVVAELYVPSSGPTLTPGWAFTAPGTNLEICFPTQAINYGGGNAVIQIDWYCLAATSGTATWKAKVIATSPGDAESVEAADNATSTTSSATTVNGTAGGLTRTTITVSALDSMVSGDKIWIKVQRDTADTSIAQTVYLTEVVLNYGDGLTGTPGSGDFVGPASSVAGNFVLFANTTGKLGADSGVAAGNLVTNAGASTDNAVARFDLATGKIVQNSGVIIDDSNNVTGLGTINTRTIATLATGPGSSTAGRVATFSSTDGITLAQGPRLEADLVAGPASATDTALMRFNGAGGKTAQNSGILVDASNNVTGMGTLNTRTIANLVAGPGAAVVSGNIMSWNGTGGATAQDSGVSATAHAARHNVGGADALFTGTWSANDRPVWNGTIWVPKHSSVTALGSNFSVTAASNTAVDITGMSIAIPRAGTYKLIGGGLYTLSGTLGAGGGYFLWNFSGTITRLHSSGFLASPGIGTGCYVYLVQTGTGAIGSTTGSGTTAATLHFSMNGILVCSTAGNIVMRAQRNGTPTATVLAGANMMIQEL